LKYVLSVTLFTPNWLGEQAKKGPRMTVQRPDLNRNTNGAKLQRILNKRSRMKRVPESKDEGIRATTFTDIAGKIF
jgi:hypothetical protein